MMDFNVLQKPKTQVDKGIWFETKDTPTLTGSHHPSAQKVSRKQRSPLLRKLIVGLVLVLLVAIATMIVRATYHHIAYAGIDTKRYQAVYLTNDNVYFGRIHVLVNGDIFLTDVFRVQATSTNSGQQATSTSTKTSASDDSSGIRLVKPGKELHAPDDTMLIKKDSVLFIENLKADGKVTQAIVDYHKQGGNN